MSALRQELPGILNWAVEGCLLWQAEGLNAPASVAASITAYRSEMDTVAGFIEDECHQDPSQKSSVASLYGQYESYCRTQNKHPRTKVQFGNALKSQGYAQVRDSTGRYWQGLSTFHDENDNNDKVSINLCQSLSWATFQIPCHSCHLCHSAKGDKYIYPLVMNTGSDPTRKWACQ